MVLVTEVVDVNVMVDVSVTELDVEEVTVAVELVEEVTVSG